MLSKYRIKPRSPVITPFMSDTFFGHFCWALAFKHGERYLTEFLDMFGQGNSAPVLFSSAFPQGFLPRPSMPALSRKKTQELIASSIFNGRDDIQQKDLFEAVNFVKEFNKRRFVPLKHWTKVKEDYSEISLMSLFFSEKDCGHPTDTITEITVSNTINRSTGTVDSSGGLFNREKHWYPEDMALDLYIDINVIDYEEDVIWFLDDFLPNYGFGADKNIGMGALLIERDEHFSAQSLEVQDANAVMALSLSSFPGIEKYQAFYRLKCKFGRLGGDFAVSSPTGGNPKPFKKPILMYEPGAVFMTSDDLKSMSLLTNVHSDERIRHCGVPVTLPFKVKETDSYEK